MDQLQLGDYIRVSATEFAPVFGFSHRDPRGLYEFRRIGAKDLRTQAIFYLQVSESHYLVTRKQSLILAGDVEPGSVLYTVTSTGLHEAEVVSVDHVRSQGLFNPHTADGRLVVNGILASCYTRAVPPCLAHSLLLPVRSLFASFGQGFGGLEKWEFVVDAKNDAWRMLISGNA